MADNKNDPKKKKNRFAPGQNVVAPYVPTWLQREKGQPTVQRARENTLPLASIPEMINSPVRQGLNFIGDLLYGFSRNKHDSYGTGVGDLLLGVTPGYYAEKSRNPGPNVSLWESAWGSPNNSRVGQTTVTPTRYKPRSAYPNGGQSEFARRNVTPTQEQPEEAPLNLAEFLKQAMSMLGGAGAADISPISYDPYRQAAREEQRLADSELAAMYGGLAQSVADDAPGIQKSYADTIAAQQAIVDRAAKGITEGYQSGNDMLAQQAEALGIGEAVGNQAIRGQTSAGDMAQRLADNAASGQTAQTQLNTNQQSALDYNTGVKQAVEQEGASARAARLAALQNMLADIDVREAEANRGVEEANRNARMGLQNTGLSLAQWLYENQANQRAGAAQAEWEKEQAAQELALKKYGIDMQYGQPRDTGMTPNEAIQLLISLLGQGNEQGLQEWARNNPDNVGYILNFIRG